MNRGCPSDGASSPSQNKPRRSIWKLPIHPLLQGNSTDPGVTTCYKTMLFGSLQILKNLKMLPKQHPNTQKGSSSSPGRLPGSAKMPNRDRSLAISLGFFPHARPCSESPPAEKALFPCEQGLWRSKQCLKFFDQPSIWSNHFHLQPSFLLQRSPASTPGCRSCSIRMVAAMETESPP